MSGGFIYGWKNSQAFADESGSTTSHQATFSQLDLLLKICENSLVVDQGYHDEVRDLCKHIRRALGTATVQLRTLEWHIPE